MSVERTMVNIYPPALERSTTGDIISMLRFMPTAGGTPLEIIAADVYALNEDLVEDFLKTLGTPASDEEKALRDKFREVLREYEKYAPEKYRVGRVMNLVLEGENAVERIRELMGDIRHRDGVTILGRYGYYRPAERGHTLETEYPASAPETREEAEAQIDLFWNSYKSRGGPLDNTVCCSPEDEPKIERSLAVIKPNAFEQPNDPRLGDVIDAMSKTGLYIIGAKVLCPTPEQMAEFYVVHKDRPFFQELVDFMSNKRSLALLYEGVGARNLIRSTALDIVRLAYTDGIMENTVHTSDSPGDFEREYGVVDFGNNPLPGPVSC